MFVSVIKKIEKLVFSVYENNTGNLCFGKKKYYTFPKKEPENLYYRFPVS